MLLAPRLGHWSLRTFQTIRKSYNLPR